VLLVGGGVEGGGWEGRGIRGCGVVQSAQGLHWIIFPGGWVGESCLVCDVHLFFCSFMQATLELAGGEE
jgi:hypothetical protein